MFENAAWDMVALVFMARFSFGEWLWKKSHARGAGVCCRALSNATAAS